MLSSDMPAAQLDRVERIVEAALPRIAPAFRDDAAIADLLSFASILGYGDAAAYEAACSGRPERALAPIRALIAATMPGGAAVAARIVARDMRRADGGPLSEAEVDDVVNMARLLPLLHLGAEPDRLVRTAMAAVQVIGERQRSAAKPRVTLAEARASRGAR